MGGIAKKVIIVAVSLLVVFALLVTVIPQIQTSVTGFTVVTDELVGVGDGAETDFTFILDRQPVETLTLVITEAVEDFTDTLGTGVLTAEGAGDGTLVYSTGAVDLNYAVAPAALSEITATYGVEDVPGILTTLANLWWIPMILVMVALIMASKAGRSLVRRAVGGRRGRKRRKR